MKVTGVVRRIDDLGRLVIPKEVRRIMRINDGDTFEIFTDTKNDSITFKKYNPSSTYKEEIESIINTMSNDYDLNYPEVIELLKQVNDILGKSEETEV